MTINMEKPYVVGMDIGGTNTDLAVVDSLAKLLTSDSVNTKKYAEENANKENICKTYKVLADDVSANDPSFITGRLEDNSLVHF